MWRVAFVFAALTTVAVAQPADRAAEARAAADAGAARFRAGDYPGAVERFSAAYELVPDPSHLFNIAQAYRHAGDCERSAAHYKRFLDAVPDPPNAAKIRAWYESEEACARTRRAPEPRPIPKVIDAPANTRAPRAALGLGAVGVVAVAVAGGFAWHARELGRQGDRELANCTLGAPCSADRINDLDARGSRANTIAGLSIAVGAGAIVGALLWLRAPRGHTATRIAVAPRDGAWVVGAFSW